MSSIQSRTLEIKVFHENLVPLLVNLSFHLILDPKSFPQKKFPTKMKPTKCPYSKRKEMKQEKRKKRGGEKAKSKSQDCCVAFKPKN